MQCEPAPRAKPVAPPRRPGIPGLAPGYWQRLADASGRAEEAGAAASMHKKKAMALVDGALAYCRLHEDDVAAQERLVAATGMMLDAESEASESPETASARRLSDMVGRSEASAEALAREKADARKAGRTPEHAASLVEELVDLELAECNRAAAAELAWTGENEAAAWAAAAKRIADLLAKPAETR